MIKLSLITAPHQILRTPAGFVQKIDHEILYIIKNLSSVMQDLGLLGINAPMMGISLSLIIVDLYAQNSSKKEKDFCVMINPKILNFSTDYQSFKEESPCFPGIQVEIQRPTKIELEYENLQGEKIIDSFQGIISSVIQHQLNILEGKNFFDSLSSLKKKLLLDKMVQKKKYLNSHHVHGSHCRHP